MLLDHPFLDPFEPVIRELFDSAFGGAFRGLAATGLQTGDVWHTEAVSIFRAACLPAFRRTQQSVGAMVLELERRILALEADEARAREKRESIPATTRSVKTILQNRQLVLRRLMDSILWVLVLPNSWVLRRLRVDRGIKRIAPDTLKPLLDAVAHNDAKARDETISLICDLTTTAQLGDLVIASWIPSRNAMKIVVAELKVGSMNKLLHKRLHQPDVSDVRIEIDRIAADLGSGAAKQAARMLRQERRLNDFVKVIATGEGTDPLSGRPFRMSQESLIYKDYRPKLSTVLARAKSDGWCGLTLDKSLHLIAQLRTDTPAQHEQLKIAHDFYHLRHGAFCAANGSEAGKNAEALAIRNAPLAVNLCDFCMRTALAIPPMLWYPRDLMLDVLAGRIEVFAQFDYEAFFQLARQLAHLNLQFVTGRQAHKIAATKNLAPLIEYRDKRFVLARTAQSRSMLYGAKFFTRLYLSECDRATC